MTATRLTVRVLLPPLDSTRMLQRSGGKQSVRQVIGRVLRATEADRLGL
jgi:hypothetical protein